MPGREADQFIGDADDQREQRDAADQFRGESIEGHQRIDQNREHHHHEAENWCRSADGR